MLGPGNIVWCEGKDFNVKYLDGGKYTGDFRKRWTAVCPFYWYITKHERFFPYSLTNGKHEWWFETWEEAAQFAFEQILLQRLKGEA